MLKDLLEKKQCFKLVCGAGNEDAIEVEKLTYIYYHPISNFQEHIYYDVKLTKIFLQIYCLRMKNCVSYN